MSKKPLMGYYVHSEEMYHDEEEGCRMPMLFVTRCLSTFEAHDHVKELQNREEVNWAYYKGCSKKKI